MNPDLPALPEDPNSVPLSRILSYFGLESRDNSPCFFHDPTKPFEAGRHGIVLVDQGWIDVVQGVSGDDAVDLILHLEYALVPGGVTDADREKATRWLAAFGQNAPAFSPTNVEGDVIPQIGLAGAVRDDTRWEEARAFLTHRYHLPAVLLNGLYVANRVFAFHRQDRPDQTEICFIHRDLFGVACGGSVLPVSDTLTDAKPVGNETTAWFTVGYRRYANRLILTEGPIEALSYYVLDKPQHALVAAMPRCEVNTSIMDAASRHGWDLVVAFGNHTLAEAAFAGYRNVIRALAPLEDPPRRIAPRRETWSLDLAEQLLWSLYRG